MSDHARPAQTPERRLEGTPRHPKTGALAVMQPGLLGAAAMCALFIGQT